MAVMEKIRIGFGDGWCDLSLVRSWWMKIRERTIMAAPIPERDLVKRMVTKNKTERVVFRAIVLGDLLFKAW